MFQNILVYIILGWAVYVIIRSIWFFFKKGKALSGCCSDKCSQACSLKDKQV